MEYDALLRENRRLQLCLDDLAGIMVLPAMWVGRELTSVADSLLDTLQRLVDPDFSYLRLNAAAGGLPAEWIRAPEADRDALDRLRSLADLPTLGSTVVTVRGDQITVAPFPLGIGGALGMLVVGSRRASFPTETERLLLGVIANLAGIALLSARQRDDERRTTERRQADLDLQAQQSLLQGVAESLAAPVVFLKPTGEIEVINNNLLSFFGKTRDEMAGWQTSEIIHPDDRPATVEALRRAIETGEPYEVEARRRRTDGVYRWWRSNGYPMRDGEGRILRWCVLYTDIQDRKVAEEALRRQEFLMNAMLESIAVPVAFWKPNGDFEAVNSIALQFHGKTLEELEDWYKVIHPDDHALEHESFQRGLREGRAYNQDLRFLDAEGVWRWRQLRAFPMRDANGEIARWCVLNLDIDDRKRAEEALAASEQKLEQIINTIPAMAWSARSDGHADFYNRHCLEYLGIPTDQIQGWNWSSIVHPDDLGPNVKRWEEVLRTGEPFESQSRLRGADGTYRWFLHRANSLKDADGIVKWFGVMIDIENLKRAEERLQTSELNLRRLTETIPQNMFGAGANGLVNYLNPQLLEWFGRADETIMAEEWIHLCHPDDRDPTIAAWTNTVVTGTPYHHQVRFIHRSGEYRWCDVRARALRDETGNITAWHGVLDDIHDRKLADDALRASARNLSQIINSIPGFTWTARPDGTAEFLSRHYLEYVGMTFEEATGTGWTRAIHPDDLGSLLSNWQIALASGLAGEALARIRRVHGEYRWFLFRYNPFFDNDGRLVKWFGINIDIEDRKRAEEKLHASEHNLRGLTEAIPQMLWRTTPEGLVDYGNSRFLEYTGYTADEIAGTGWIRILHPDDIERTERVWGHSVATGEPYHIEYRVRRAADNTYRWCLVTALPLRDDDGSIMKWHGCCIDVHDWKLAQDQLRETQAELAHVTRVMTMGQLTASIAHELNQPLSGIMTNAGTGMRMLSADPPNVPGAKETVKRTIRDAQRASEVIARLRALFSGRQTSSEVVDINAAAREVMALTSGELQRKGVSLRADLGPNLPYVMCDRIQLQQVILNLVLNGAEAMDGLEAAPRELVISTFIEPAGNIQVSIRDCGTGFGSEIAERLFSPFFTTKSSGMGIGLSVSRTIVENHKGRLWAENNDGPGATFYFTIPSTAADAPA